MYEGLTDNNYEKCCEREKVRHSKNSQAAHILYEARRVSRVRVIGSSGIKGDEDSRRSEAATVMLLQGI